MTHSCVVSNKLGAAWSATSQHTVCCATHVQKPGVGAPAFLNDRTCSHALRVGAITLELLVQTGAWAALLARLVIVYQTETFVVDVKFRRDYSDLPGVGD